jgi:hypothetical protein
VQQFKSFDCQIAEDAAEGEVFDYKEKGTELSKMCDCSQNLKPSFHHPNSTDG